MVDLYYYAKDILCKHKQHNIHNAYLTVDLIVGLINSYISIIQIIGIPPI